jgi:outer membrane receptor protein involved in Fe transport
MKPILAAFLSLLWTLALLADEPRAATDNSQPAVDSIYVYGDRYHPIRQEVPPWLKFMVGFSFPGFPFAFGWQTAGPVVVTPSRTPQSPGHTPTKVTVLDETAFRLTPAATLHSVLRAAPGFGPHSGNDNSAADAAAQGLSLRAPGPSAASRALGLLDGVPLNDPFDGRIAWIKVPREGLAHTEIVPNGGATAWGNAAMGGVVQCFAVPLRTESTLIDEPPKPYRVAYRGTLRLAAMVGDFGTRSLEAALTTPVGTDIAQVLGRAFATDGVVPVAPERRGPVDVAAWNRHRWTTARWLHGFGPNLNALATVRYYEEFRGNGTRYRQAHSRETVASFTLAGRTAGPLTWNAAVTVHRGGTASTGSVIDATRTAETPAFEQFAVPTTAGGATWTGAWQHASGALTSFGADGRVVRGETRENVAFVNGAFTRRLFAGGEQALTGAFASHAWPLSAELKATLGARLDAWSDSDGHRREADRATGTLWRDERYANRRGALLCPSAGFVWQPAKEWRVRTNIQQAFRRPTLNELYRPLRADTDYIEANAALGTERLTGGELSAEWSVGNFAKPIADRPPPSPRPVASKGETTGGPVTRRPPAQPPPRLDGITVGASVFWNDLHNAVGAVAQARGPATFPGFGTLPVGVIGRQRLNIDRVSLRGLELSARWRASDTLRFDATALLCDAKIRYAAVAPALVGARLADVPRGTATFSALCRCPGFVLLTPRVRWIGRRFGDLENTRRLGQAVVVDFGASRPLTTHLELFATIENLGDARVETDRTADGVVRIGMPRHAVAGLRGRW